MPEQMNESIIVVDFDVIMYPYIKLYCRDVVKEESPSVMWDNLQRELNILNSIRYDAKALDKVHAIITQLVTKGVPFFRVENLEQEDVFISECMDTIGYLDIIHIGWEPALFNPDDIANANVMVCRENNWASYLMLNDICHKYHWYSTPTSPRIELTEAQSSLFGDDSYEVHSFMRENFIFPERVKSIYFRFNPHFVPTEYLHLFRTFSDGYEYTSTSLRFNGNKLFLPELPPLVEEVINEPEETSCEGGCINCNSDCKPHIEEKNIPNYEEADKKEYGIKFGEPKLVAVEPVAPLGVPNEDLDDYIDKVRGSAAK